MVNFTPLRQLRRSRLPSFRAKTIYFLPIVFSLIFIIGWQRAAYAYQEEVRHAAFLAETGGITGYIVGSGDVAAFACPDVNTAKCPIRLMLHPGTAVQIIDNVVGSNVPGLNDNAWRKIVYQGQTLFVPMRYVSINPPGKGSDPDISLVQTSFEDDSTSPPNTPTNSGFSTAPGSQVITGTGRNPTPPHCADPSQVMDGSGYCCPPGFTFQSVDFVNSQSIVNCVQPKDLQTRYVATDGRIDGSAGDRIAIYCRSTGRIEVWSINDGQGHFLVEFNHAAVDAAGNKGFSVSIGAQGVVTIGGDGHGLYWAAIHGGPYHATGAGDFAKIFHCYVTP